MDRGPTHIEPSEPVTETVIVMGDPARVRKLSALLGGARVINEKRGYLIVKGALNGVEVTLASHGIGGPSLLILVEELAMLGARTIIRIGSTGALRGEIGIGDVVVASGAVIHPGTCGLQLYTGDLAPPTCPDPELLLSLERSLRGRGLRVVRGPVYCSDSFYAESWEVLAKARNAGAISVDMETGALYAIASIRGLRAASMLAVSNVIREHGEVWAEPGLLDEVFKTMLLAVGDTIGG